MKKRVLAMVLTALLCLGIIGAFLPSALAFSDIADTETAEAAETLRLLGVVNGTGGNAFQPNGALTRAAFCKMALITAGRGEETLAQSGRVVFPDVTAAHWALGYVNAAVSVPSGGTDPLIRGRGDGNFHPDDNITFGEAVTILMRMLGYTDSDMGTGAAWYSGYLSAAAATGLTDGITRAGTDVITRGEAARLFRKLLFTELKDSTTLYLTKLDGSILDNTVILSIDATADDGTTGSVKTSLGTYKTESTSMSAELEGVRGKLALDKSGKLLTVLPEESDTIRRVSLVSCDADHVTVAGGETLAVSLDTVVWKDDESSTYENTWMNLHPGTPLVFCYNGTGSVVYIYIPAVSATESAVVVKNAAVTVNPFSSLTGGATGCSLYKNGVTATLSDLRQYDIGTYDKSSNTIYVSDLRLTGVYENAYPNRTAPSSVTVMGTEFKLLPGAISDLSAFDLGDSVTLLFTGDLRVAGVVSAAASRASAVGIARMTGTSASVTLLDGRITVSGKTTLSADNASKLDGQLVSVTSSKVGYLSLVRLSENTATSSLNVAAGTAGGKSLAKNVRIYEKVGYGVLTEITLDDITVSSVPASKIAYMSTDYAGRINQLVLNDVTGDCYNYGYFVYTYGTPGTIDNPGSNDTVAIRNADSSGNETTSAAIECGISVSDGKPGGVAATAAGRLAAYVVLDSEKGLHRSAFDLEGGTVTTTDAVYPICKDVQCYNNAAGTWYIPGSDGLALALAFSDNLTIYFDRAPEDGGKVRLVVAN